MNKLKLAFMVAYGAVFILFVILLGRYLWPEELVLLYLLPVFLVFALALVTQALVRLFKKIRFGATARIFLAIGPVFQVLLLGVLLWSATPRSHTRQQVLGDLDFGLGLMEDMHPNLYAVTDRDSVKALVASLSETLPEKISEAASQKFVSTVVASLHDAHTMVAMDQYLNRGSILFRKAPPHGFRIIGERVFVRKNYSWRRKIPIGSEIIEINGKPSFEYLNDVAGMISHETQSYRDAWLEYPLFWGLWNEGREFELTYLTPGGERETITTGSGLMANISYLWDMADGQFRYGSFEILDGDIGYLNIKAFQGGDTFEGFLSGTFQEIREKKVENLIIDLRENSGGSTELAKELMQYVSPVEFNVFDSSVVKISERLITAYSLDRSEYELGDMLEEASGMVELRDNPLRFEGRCFVLIGGMTFSTALDFAAMARCFGVGEIIGTDTGGRTVSSGSPFHFELPETGMKMKVSIKRFENACGDGGVIRPDHVVANSIEDDMRGVDRALEYARALSQ